MILVDSKWHGNEAQPVEVTSEGMVIRFWRGNAPVLDIELPAVEILAWAREIERLRRIKNEVSDKADF